MLIIAVLSMLAAVSLYTTGVFSERKAKLLKKNHIFIFWAGLFFDTLGTTIMGKISQGISFNFHGITGLLALILMFLHVIWATVVFNKGTIKQKTDFHTYSLIVWLIWLIPFITGMLLNM